MKSFCIPEAQLLQECIMEGLKLIFDGFKFIK